MRDRGGELPVRPSLPPTLALLAGVWSAVSFAQAAWVGARAGEVWAGMEPRLACLLVCAALLLACACLGVFRAARGVAALAATGLVAGALAGSLSAASTIAKADAVDGFPVSSCLLRVESDPRYSSATGAWRFEADVVQGPAEGVRVQVALAGTAVDAPADLGALVRCVGSWDALDVAQEYDASLLKRGVSVCVKAATCEAEGFQAGAVGMVRALRVRLLAAVDPYRDERRALVAGVVCGMQAALASFSVNDAFSDLGLSHLVAVSGSHLAVVAALVGSLFGRLRVRPAGRLVATAALLAVYVAFTGFQPSAIRSWFMATMALGATVAGRRSHGVSAVALAATVMLLVDPACAATMGFALSVLSVVGLVLFASLAKAWAVCLLPRKTPEQVGEAVALTSVSQVATLPVALPAFGTLPLLAPLANVVAGPLVSLLLGVGLACVGLAGIVPGAADALLAPCDVLAGVTVRWAHLLACVPVNVLCVEVGQAALACAVAVLAATVYLIWPAPSRRAALAVGSGGLFVAVAAVLGWWVFAPARVVVLDVGQGDAILVQDGPHALLVDTGPDDAVAYALARNHVLWLEAVVVTHTDADHVGGLDDLAGRVPVGNVVVASGVASAVQQNDPALEQTFSDVARRGVVEVDETAVLRVGAFRLDVVWPCEPVAGDENEQSVVMLLSYDKEGRTMSALLTGDAESPVVERLIAEGLVGRVDLLKVGHHGSTVSTSDAMMEALDPLVAVASAGVGNRYGHPTQTCVDCIAAHGTTLFLCTADAGDVQVEPARSGVEVSCARKAARAVAGRTCYARGTRRPRRRREGRAGGRETERGASARISHRGNRRAQAPPPGRAP